MIRLSADTSGRRLENLEWEKFEGPGFEKSLARGSGGARGGFSIGDAGCRGGDRPGLNQSIGSGDAGRRGDAGGTASSTGSGFGCGDAGMGGGEGGTGGACGCS